MRAIGNVKPYKQTHDIVNQRKSALQPAKFSTERTGREGFVYGTHRIPGFGIRICPRTDQTHVTSDKLSLAPADIVVINDPLLSAW